MAKLELWESALVARDTDGFYGVQRTGHGGKESGLTPDRLYHPYGFIGIHRDPTSSGAGQLFYQRFGSGEGFAWLVGDPRDVNVIPPVKNGGSCQYAADGCFQIFDPDTHTKSTYIPYADGKAHLETVGVDGNGTPIMEYVHGNGMALTMLDRTLVLKNADGDSYIQLDDNGCILNANLKVTGAVEVNGAKITPTGDVVTSTGVSLMLHTHPTALGPSGPPIPTPGA